MDIRWQFVSQICLLLGSATVAGSLAVYLWRHRHLPGAAACLVLLTSAFIWSTGALFESVATDLPTKMLFIKLQSVGRLSVPLAWLALALRWAGYERWLTRRRLLYLSVVPVLTLVLFWTNDLHGLMWSSVRVDGTGPLTAVVRTRSTWAWVNMTYSYLLILASLVVLLRGMPRMPPSYRSQALIMLGVLLLPLTVDLLAVLGLDGGRFYQFGACAFSISGALAAWGFLRFWLLDIVPVARNTVVESMEDGVVVLDLRKRIVDFNPAARRILGWEERQKIGVQAGEAFRLWPELRELCCGLPAAHTEIASIAGGARRYYDVTISRLACRRAGEMGQLITLHDITERKRIEENLTYASFHDPLTELYNRAYFEEEMRRLETGRFYPITIVGTDVDVLKLINDTMGHRMGDDLLRAYAAVLRASVRSIDVVARVGGDEFAMILPHTDEEAAQEICNRMEREVANHNHGRPDLPLSISWGTETSRGPDLPLDQAFRLADLNMYRHKASVKCDVGEFVIDSLLSALGTKDFAQEGHTQRVRELAGRMGEAANLSGRELRDVELLGEVHDLGKVSIPDQVLFKVEPLTPQEREEIESHCTVGYKIAKSTPSMERIAELILHHHEWWNGAGYPAGLRGEEIPLASRIVSIVNAYDAMTSERPHRPAMSSEKALSELQAGAGTQFDPSLVAMFVGIMRAVRQQTAVDLVPARFS